MTGGRQQYARQQESDLLRRLEEDQYEGDKLTKDLAETVYQKGEIEGLARMIYALLPYDGVGQKPAWVLHGNSDKQEYCRRQALGCIRRGEV